MSNGTVTITATLSVVTSESQPESMGVAQLQFSQTGKRVAKGVMQTSTGAAAIPLPGGTNGWAIFKNLDATNTISLRPGAGGANFCDIPPAGIAGPFFLSSGNTPYAIAGAGTPDLAYEVLEA